MTLATEFDEPRVSRRRRRKSVRIDSAAQIANRVVGFFDKDCEDADGDIGDRLQRYAKLRMWRDGPKDWPWPDASDAAVPDMAEQSYRTQDTLHNAVMSQRPVVQAVAVTDKDDKRGEKVDTLLDFQLFNEQAGETIIGDLIQDFVNDGVCTAFVPWVRETRDVQEIKIFEPIPVNVNPIEYFESILRLEFPESFPTPMKGGWDFKTFDADDNEIDAHFYTMADDRIELAFDKTVVIYDGPKIIAKAYQDVITPARVANLLTPGPSNPGGAPHVILRDYPTIDEIKRQVEDGFYDLPGGGNLSKKDFFDQLDTMSTTDKTDDDVEEQKDAFGGREESAPIREAQNQGTLTRLTCFDLFDVNKKGRDEDVIWWVLLETKTLLRARRLTEMYPALPPRRPFAEANYLPIAGRRAGLGLLELVEGLHDLKKQIFDQSIDGGTIANVPFGFYRPQGAMKPEILRMIPGEMYPLGDPQKDQSFPNIGNPNQAFGLNLMTLLNQFEERLTMQGDIQFGRVPPGRSSALRTVGGISLLSGQGEARPERVMRRLFIGLTQMFEMMHRLNTVFLPPEKQVRLLGPLRSGKSPFITIGSREEITGNMRFKFDANILNTSKQAQQGSLQEFGAAAFTELGFQTGIATPSGFFAWLLDYGDTLGLDAEKYIEPTNPDDRRRKILAEEAIHDIVSGMPPDGVPLEPAIEHMQKLIEFANSDNLGFLDGEHVELFQVYLQTIRERIDQEAQQASLQSSAPPFGAGGQDAGGRPPENAPDTGGNPQVQGGELLDETLPSAGGGGQEGAQ